MGIWDGSFVQEEEAGIEASWIGVDGMKRSVEYWEGESEESEGDEVLHILRRNKESRHTQLRLRQGILGSRQSPIL